MDHQPAKAELSFGNRRESGRRNSKQLPSKFRLLQNLLRLDGGPRRYPRLHMLVASNEEASLDGKRFQSEFAIAVEE